MLVDFRRGLKVFPQTCPRGLVFRVAYNPNASRDEGAAGPIALVLDRLPLATAEKNAAVDRRGGIVVVEWKVHELISRHLPKVGGSPLHLFVIGTDVRCPEVSISRNAVGGGVKLALDVYAEPRFTMTIFCEDFEPNANVKTPIETGTFAREEAQPAQTAWERLVSDEEE